MYNNLHKYKPHFSWLIKLGIVSVAIYFIYIKLAHNELLSFELFKKQFKILVSNNFWKLIIVLLFTDANWLLEILKWKTLVSSIQRISFLNAFEQSLASQTVSIITPNRIGEYGAKALYFKKEKRNKIVLLNLIGNLSQLSITCFFGIFGLFFMAHKIDFPNLNFTIQNTLILIIFIGLLIIFRKNIRLSKILLYLKKIKPKIFLRTLLYSFLRYLFFSHQFYFLLYLFGNEVDYFTIMNLLFSLYLIASIIPSLSIFDWAIKGSIAVWLFSFFQVNELTILTITTLMWLLNVVSPAVIGSLFILNYNSNKAK